MAGELEGYSFLNTVNFQRVFDEIIIAPEEYMFQSYIMPYKEEAGSIIKWDIRKNLTGMTQAVSRGSESAIVETRGAAQKVFTPGEFRDKIVIVGPELQKLRKLGTVNDRETLASWTAQKSLEMKARVMSRIEWCIYQALTGTLTVSNNKVNYSISYNVPSRLRPTLTGNNRWNQVSTSSPISNLYTWKQLYLGLGVTPVEIWMNSNTEQYLMQNTNEVTTKIGQVIQGGYNIGVNREILQKVVNYYVGNMSLKVYDKGYHEVTAMTAASSGATVTVSDVSAFAAADTVYIKNFDHTLWETATISSINTTTKVITMDANLTNSYVVGDEVQIFKPFLPSGKVIIKPQLPPTTSGGTDIGNFISCDSEYKGTMDNPQPGMYVKVLNKQEEDPPRIELIYGVVGAPLYWHPWEGCLFASVY